MVKQIIILNNIDNRVNRRYLYFKFTQVHSWFLIILHLDLRSFSFLWIEDR